MYFYTHKTSKDENEQAQLLEVRGHACLHYGNGTGIHGIRYSTN